MVNSERALVAPEREQLEAFLADNRAEIVRLLDGLTEEQARRKLVPSLTTLLGLVKHCSFAETVWFQVSLGGKTRAELGLPDDVDSSFRLSEQDTIESIRGLYLDAVRTGNEIARQYQLDDVAVHNRRGELSLRWIYIHMIEELARHAGHGDILREQIFASDQ